LNSLLRLQFRWKLVGPESEICIIQSTRSHLENNNDLRVEFFKTQQEIFKQINIKNNIQKCRRENVKAISTPKVKRKYRHSV